ncbi:MAG TPA: Maf family protein [Eubacteriales bacterium]|nr:Maf family protein [Eubacteriales bacterium]
MKIILASQSPRRSEVMKWMGLSFEVEPCTEPERAPEGADALELVCAMALQKAEFIAKKHPDDCVIGADTVVLLDGEVLGKPRNAENAVAYLSRMQGRTHTVYTGVAVIANGKVDVRHCETEVLFRRMSREEIEWYVSTGDPLDKAGAYGVQGIGCLFVDSIKGNYFNIIGLPVPLVYDMLKEAGAVLYGSVQL